MSIKVMSWYWDHSKQEGHKLLILLALADWANEDGECFPSVAGLAKRARRDKRSIQRTIKELEESGEILVYQGMGKGPDGQRSPLYYLLKYRQANAIQIPPMIVEAAKYYREQSRRQGQKGIEVRKAQAALLDPRQGVTPTPPPTGDIGVTPTGDIGVTPTGDIGVTPTGDIGVTQIRQYDPSFDPSDATTTTIRDRESEDGCRGRRQTDPVFAEVCTVYENEIGTLTAMSSDELGTLVDEHPREWILDAIRIAVRQNSRKLSYVSAVLSNWKRDGRGGKPAKKGKTNAANAATKQPETARVGNYDWYSQYGNGN